MADRVFSPGARFSSGDAVALLVFLMVAGDIGAIAPGVGAAIIFVVAHFFLFCNILRMERSAELMWAAFFVALSVRPFCWARRAGW